MKRGRKCFVEQCFAMAPFACLKNPDKHACEEHKKRDFVNMRNKRCLAPGCYRNPHYGVSRSIDPNSKAQFCTEHKAPGMENVNGGRCAGPGCSKQPRFAFPGSKGKFCSKHREEGMVDVLYTPCATEGCKKHPHFGFTTGGPRYCAQHRDEGMVDVKHRRCAAKGCRRDRLQLTIGPRKRGKFCEVHTTENETSPSSDAQPLQPMEVVPSSSAEEPVEPELNSGDRSFTNSDAQRSPQHSLGETGSEVECLGALNGVAEIIHPASKLAHAREDNMRTGGIKVFTSSELARMNGDMVHRGSDLTDARGNHVLPSNWSGFRSEPMAGQRDLRQELPADRYALREDDQNVSHALPIARAEPSHARDATDHYARSSRREKGIRSQCNTQRPHCRLELTDNAQYPLFSRDKRAECTTLETIEGTSYDHQGGNTRRPVQPFRLRCCQPLCNQVDEPWYPFPWKMVRDKHNPAAPAAYYGSGCDPIIGNLTRLPETSSSISRLCPGSIEDASVDGEGRREKKTKRLR